LSSSSNAILLIPRSSRGWHLRRVLVIFQVEVTLLLHSFVSPSLITSAASLLPSQFVFWHTESKDVNILFWGSKFQPSVSLLGWLICCNKITWHFCCLASPNP
jgi:hypothetical protein